MTDGEKRNGKEILVIGYAMSIKTWKKMQNPDMKFSKEVSNYLTDLPRELAHVDMIYPTIGDEFNTWGSKFAIQHKSKKILFIEPFQKTHMIGFNEFYHKKGWSFWDIFDSTDPNLFKNLSSFILFEGDYITTFGLVKYQLSEDSFSMTKPIAIVRGGIDALVHFFTMEKNEKMAKFMGFFGLGMVSAAATVG
mmetsp:Transcript_23679/g.21044  ORF Transcript_23679/g.21044 Transcript_23679/m.21044 type:complete len:193 (+) Transcript_23679:193-771(+)|eukprot:CAMPEP_0205807380 /NCGR_PEP_ID=MMETSP0205-20121125/11104_1 /ASSEMBLY_ACC=CAM_ASM_000278 /TAXON_ID=36767 /ORGANISM="Euplotes focardii, Strain TN1" /LENGTH=192 /DNA_ID=CAMNT_0053081541 /DNA_START=132 /DNA_END=710 /DNA_ORIENTATION=-